MGTAGASRARQPSGTWSLLHWAQGQTEDLTQQAHSGRLAQITVTHAWGSSTNSLHPPWQPGTFHSGSWGGVGVGLGEVIELNGQFDF